MKYFPILLLLVVFSACKTQQATQKTQTQQPTEKKEVAAPVAATWQTVYDNCRKQNLQFSTYAASGKLVATVEGGEPLEVSYRLNIQNDSMIWLKLSKMGFEGMRVLITPHKIQALDMLNSKAYLMNFEKVGTLIGMNVDFRTLQDLLVGNIPHFPTDSVQFSEENTAYRLSFSQAGRNFDYQVEKQNHKLQAIRTNKPNDTQNAEMQFSDYQPVETYQSPFMVKVNFNAKETGNFELTHNKVALNATDLQFNFTIPDGFSVEEK